MTSSLTKRSFKFLIAAAIAMPPLAFAADAPSTAATQPANPHASARYCTLWYPQSGDAKNGVVEFYNELTVRQDTPGSYFCAEGFAGGYFGIQDRPDKKVIIFSVWDTGKHNNDPSKVAEENQVKTVFLGDGVHYERFGNEGTGAHSDVRFDWEVGKTYQFFVRATVNDKTTEYEGWFRDPTSTDGWKHIATFSAPDGGKKLKGLYSFLEDFRRDGKSATEVRRVEFGNGWVKTAPDAEWIPVLKMRFATQDFPGARKDGIDAGVIGNHFYLQNGGDTRTTMKIGQSTTRPAAADAAPPTVPITSPTTRP